MTDAIFLFLWTNTKSFPVWVCGVCVCVSTVCSSTTIDHTANKPIRLAKQRVPLHQPPPLASVPVHNTHTLCCSHFASVLCGTTDFYFPYFFLSSHLKKRNMSSEVAEVKTDAPAEENNKVFKILILFRNDKVKVWDRERHCWPLAHVHRRSHRHHVSWWHTVSSVCSGSSVILVVDLKASIVLYMNENCRMPDFMAALNAINYKVLHSFTTINGVHMTLRAIFWRESTNFAMFFV